MSPLVGRYRSGIIRTDELYTIIAINWMAYHSTKPSSTTRCPTYHLLIVLVCYHRLSGILRWTYKTATDKSLWLQVIGIPRFIRFGQPSTTLTLLCRLAKPTARNTSAPGQTFDSSRSFIISEGPSSFMLSWVRTLTMVLGEHQPKIKHKQ